MAEPEKADVETEEAYERICGICFTEVDAVENPRGRLNSCNHLFCSFCIKEWAKSTNVCPTCKALFTRIYTKHAGSEKEEETKVRRRNYTAWLNDEDEDDSELNETIANTTPQVLCDVCHEGHSAVRMIMCDRRQCTYTAHLECIGLTSRPLTFLCPSCSAKGLTESATPGRLSASAPTEEQPSSSSVPVVVAAEPPRLRASTLPPPEPRRPPMGPSPKIPMRSPLVQQPGSEVVDATARRPALRPQQTAENPPLPLPEGPVDFSKPYLMYAGGAVPSSANNVYAANSSETADDADLYFLKPTAHSQVAKQQLQEHKKAQQYMAQQRQQKREDAVRRMYESKDYNAILHHHRVSPGPASLPKEVFKRGRRGGDPAQENLTEIAEIDGLLGDDKDRQRTEDKMTYEWAAEIVPVLRRNNELENARLRLNSFGEVDRAPPLTTTEVEAREAVLWEKALKQARPMVQQKIQQGLYSLRKRKQELLNAQAQRESAALAKLARVIALHRARTGV